MDLLLTGNQSNSLSFGFASNYLPPFLFLRWKSDLSPPGPHLQATHTILSSGPTETPLTTLKVRAGTPQPPF